MAEWLYVVSFLMIGIIWGVVLLPPCVNRSTDRYTVEATDSHGAEAENTSRASAGAIRVSLTAIRGLSAEAVQHILAIRMAFGPYASLLDFCGRVDRELVDRRSLLVLIKLGAFSFTGLPRAQLALAEQVYATTGELLRAADRRPTAIAPLEEDLQQLVSHSACRDRSRRTTVSVVRSHSGSDSGGGDRECRAGSCCRGRHGRTG